MQPRQRRAAYGVDSRRIVGIEILVSGRLMPRYAEQAVWKNFRRPVFRWVSIKIPVSGWKGIIVSIKKTVRIGMFDYIKLHKQPSV